MDDLIKDAREAFEAAVSADRDNRDAAVEDLRYLTGDQWPEDIARQRQSEGRPVLTFNRLGQYERQITGDMRLNPPGIKVRPVDGSADPKTAETLTGLVRNIEAQSDGVSAFVTAGANAVRCGEGWFGLTYDYVDDSFDMELAFRRIPSPLAVVRDPGSVSATASDAGWMFVQTMLPIATFKAQYPKASVTGWDSDKNAWGDWRDGDFVRVAEWWRKVAMKRRLILCASGAVIDATDKDDSAIAGAVQAAGGFLREREADGWRVEMLKLSGMEELEDRHDWPGTIIPLFRVVGEEVDVGGRQVRYGIVRQARAPQTLYNIQRTALAEAAAMAPKPKWLVTSDMIRGFEQYWGAANTSNLAYLPFNADPKMPMGPQRVAPDLPAASVMQDAMLAAQDIEATIGIYRENLGKESNAQSGKAILSRQREGDVGTFLYMDNLASAVTQAGRCLIDVLPRVYDTPRQVRVLGEDGKPDFAPINWTDPATGQKFNDLSVGRYDVVASVGPSFSTRREEARESMMTALQVAPQLAQIGLDIFARAQDWPYADEFAKRARTMMVATGVAEPEQGDPPPKPQPPSAEHMLAQAEGMKAQAAMAKAQQDGQIRAQELQLEAEKIRLEWARLGIERDVKVAGAQDDAQRTQLERVKVAATIADKAAGHRGAAQDRHMRAADAQHGRMERAAEFGRKTDEMHFGRHERAQDRAAAAAQTPPAG